MVVTSSSASSTSVRELTGPDEWDTRVKLAACYRLMAHFGFTDLTYNHLSARIPNRPDRYLIKDQQQIFEEVTASSLLTYDMDGCKVHDLPGGVSQGGLVIHGGIMAARSDIMAVFHTHTAANVGVSAQRCGLLPLSQQAVRFYNRIGYHEFAGFEFNLAGRSRLLNDLGSHLVVLLKNHGAIACGRSLPEAFVLHHRLESACRSQIAALSAGGIEQLDIPAPEIAEAAAQQVERLGRDDENGRDWAALIRLADRLDPSYRN